MTHQPHFSALAVLSIAIDLAGMYCTFAAVAVTIDVLPVATATVLIILGLVYGIRALIFMRLIKQPESASQVKKLGSLRVLGSLIVLVCSFVLLIANRYIPQNFGLAIEFGITGLTFIYAGDV